MEKWHRINFKIKWDGNLKNVRWFIDLLIIDLLIRPTIENFRSELEIWRFHRRANNDSSGHQLSFIFYTTPITAKNVFVYLTSNRFYKIIVDNYLEANRFGLTAGKDNIEATSDDSWPLETQRSWPYYIMGVSDMFIKLIKEVKENITDQVKENNKEELENYYKKIREEIIKQWLKHGQNAFLHHLGAIFGYKPTLFKPRGEDIDPKEVIL